MTRSAGHERVDARRVAAEVGHRVAHGREVDDRGDAGEVLQDDPRGHERDLGLGAGRPGASRRAPRRPRAGRSPPPAWRSTFSSRTLSVTGRRAEVEPAAHGVEPVVGRGARRRATRGRRRGRWTWHASDPLTAGAGSRRRGCAAHRLACRRCLHSNGASVPRGPIGRRRGRASVEAPERGAAASSGGASCGAPCDLLSRRRRASGPEHVTATRHRATTPTRTALEPGRAAVVGIVGAGAVGTALGVALSRAGWPVAARRRRDPGRRERFRALVAGRAGASPSRPPSSTRSSSSSSPSPTTRRAARRARSGCTAARR